MIGKKFERDRLAEFQIVGAIDFAHAASAEQTDDAITLGEDVPGTKRASSIESKEIETDRLSLDLSEGGDFEPLRGVIKREPTRRTRSGVAGNLFLTSGGSSLAADCIK